MTLTFAYPPLIYTLTNHSFLFSFYIFVFSTFRLNSICIIDKCNYISKGEIIIVRVRMNWMKCQQKINYQKHKTINNNKETKLKTQRKHFEMIFLKPALSAYWTLFATYKRNCELCFHFLKNSSPLPTPKYSFYVHLMLLL